MNPLTELARYGQSIYLDEIRRSWIHQGRLQGMIDDDGLRGVTSNPAIFQKAIANSNDYDTAIAQSAREGLTALTTYENLVVADIQDAADLFRPMYDASEGVHGYVSLEVSPELANDEEGTVKEGLHLWDRLARPNVFIKVPATEAGVPAIKRLIASGVNVNVTLLFGLQRYRQVVYAYLEGLEERVGAGVDVSRVASVASFFLSRIDVKIDPLLGRVQNNGGPQASAAAHLRGTAAVASAKQAYQIYLDEFAKSERFAALAAAGARPQRLLWASTSTKDPAYPDTKYVEPLIGQDTINTLPPETLEAYRDHGSPGPDRVLEGAADSAALLSALTGMGIDLDQVVRELEEEGVDKFVAPFRSLMGTLTEALAKAPA